MLTITQALITKLKKMPFLEAGLADGLINTSALARKTAPILEKELQKPVTASAVIMSLKRIKDRMEDKPLGIDLSDMALGLNIRSGLCEYTFMTSPSLPEKLTRLFKHIEDGEDIFYGISQGLAETTIIVSGDLGETVEDICSGELILTSVQNISAITIKLRRDNVTTPGVYYTVFKALAWEGLNVIECNSTSNELTIFLDSADAKKAFGVLEEAVTRTTSLASSI